MNYLTKSKNMNDFIILLIVISLMILILQTVGKISVWYSNKN